jgi:hypothetical protein
MLSDNGGQDIEGYGVYYRIRQAHFPTQWRYKGIYSIAHLGNRTVRMHIYNLMPHVVYEFKVFAYNSIGDSDLSVRSTPLLIQQVSVHSFISLSLSLLTLHAG